jgi:hypothetical protein
MQGKSETDYRVTDPTQSAPRSWIYWARKALGIYESVKSKVENGTVTTESEFKPQVLCYTVGDHSWQAVLYRSSAPYR